VSHLTTEESLAPCGRTGHEASESYGEPQPIKIYSPLKLVLKSLRVQTTQKKNKYKRSVHSRFTGNVTGVNFFFFEKSAQFFDLSMSGICTHTALRSCSGSSLQIEDASAFISSSVDMRHLQKQARKKAMEGATYVRAHIGYKVQSKRS